VQLKQMKRTLEAHEKIGDAILANSADQRDRRDEWE